MKKPQHNALHHRRRSLSEQDLQDEIRYFRGRIEELGDPSNCAYERAIVRAYEEVIWEHEERLCELQYQQAG